MQNAQIWKSMEALCDEAEAVARTRCAGGGGYQINGTASPKPTKSASAPTEESSKNSTVGRLSDSGSASTTNSHP